MVFFAQESMLHGDLKPENIIVVMDAAGQVLRARLIDFGLAFRRHHLKRNMYAYICLIIHPTLFPI